MNEGIEILLAILKNPAMLALVGVAWFAFMAGMFSMWLVMRKRI